MRYNNVFPIFINFKNGPLYFIEIGCKMFYTLFMNCENGQANNMLLSYILIMLSHSL